MPQPSISVVITCYNLERYIGEAIESVLSQDVAPLEIIVVDDCSTDRSREVVARYPVQLVARDRNGGVLQAMLDGLERVQGEIVCLLDGDDLWEPNKLGQVSQAFFVDPALTFLTHDLSYIGSEGRPLLCPTRAAQVMNAAPREQWPALVRDGILRHDDHVWLGSAMAFCRNAIDLPGFAELVRSLRDARNTYQDWPLATWIAAQPSARCGYLPAPLFRYRLHQANHSGDARTAERAARNWRRTANTLAAQALIQRRFRAGAAEIRTIEDRARLAGWLADLYAGERGAAALRTWASLLPELRASGLLVKETARAALLILLGPRLGTRLITRWAEGG